MRNATSVLPFKMRRSTSRHYFLCINFRPFSFFTRTMCAKINPACYCCLQPSIRNNVITYIFWSLVFQTVFW